MQDTLGDEPFSVGDWRVEPGLRRIVCGSEEVKIDPRNMRALQLLASRPGQVVTQAEIEQFVWSGVVVTPNSVYQSIAQLRKALGQDKSNRRYIETVSRRGYRLIAAVAPATSPLLPMGGGDDALAEENEPLPKSLPDAPPRVSPGRLVIVGAVLGASFLVAAGVAFVHLNGPVSERGLEAPASDLTADAPSLGDPNARVELPQAYQVDRTYRQGIQYLEQVLASQIESVGPDDPSLVTLLSQLANLYPLISNPVKSEQAARRGLDILVEQGSEISSEGVEINATLAEALADLERYVEAERHLLHAIELSRRVHGELHQATVDAFHQLALLRIAEGRFVEAEHHARRALETYAGVPDSTSARAAHLSSTLTWALTEQGRFEDAIVVGSAALTKITPEDAPAPYLVALAHHFLGEALSKANRYQEAEVALRRELELLATIPHVRMDGARGESALGEVLFKRGFIAEAQALLANARRSLEEGDGWRERKARRETEVRWAALRRAQAHATQSAYSAAADQ